MISKMTITGANPLTAGLYCQRVVPVERERERNSVSLREREGERERQPVRQRVGRWWTVTTPETGSVADGGTGCARLTERETERQRESERVREKWVASSGSYP
jgi:hypothetical protein